MYNSELVRPKNKEDENIAYTIFKPISKTGTGDTKFHTATLGRIMQFLFEM